MLGAITSTQLDQMKQQLIVPLAVSDILHHNLHVESDMQYGLHMALSEVDPDSALLAIALCAQDLATKCLNKAPIAAALQKEASDILQDYAPTWLRHNLNSPMPSHIYEEVLDTVPEDLESLADLIDALEADLGNEAPSITTLANLLSIQARAHMEIAEFVLAEIAYEKQCDGDRTQEPNFGFASVQKEKEDATGQAGGFAGDNIIVFPGAV